MKSRRFAILLIVCILCAGIFSTSVSALTTNRISNSVLVRYTYNEPPFFIYFWVTENGWMDLCYSNHTSPYPGYLQIEQMYLFADAVNVNNGLYPFDVVADLSNIKRYDYGSSTPALVVTSFSYYDILQNFSWFDDSWCTGVNYTNSYLVKDSGSTYKFVGSTVYRSDMFPWTVYLTYTKTYSYY